MPEQTHTHTEGVDFIETEEDARAVEAATLKIQSTFRGKKIRKLGAKEEQQKRETSDAGRQQSGQTSGEPGAELAKELSDKVAGMQVNDNSGDQMKASAGGAAHSVSSTRAPSPSGPDRICSQ